MEDSRSRALTEMVTEVLIELAIEGLIEMVTGYVTELLRGFRSYLVGLCRHKKAPA